MNKIIRCSMISIFLGLAPSEMALGGDITSLVINETQLDEEISAACSDHCQGNRRRGELRRFLIERTDLHSFFVRAEVALRNYHHVDPPTVLGRRVGGGFALYDYTILAVAEGTLDDQSCMLRIDNIQLENDRLGISSLARSQIGKIYYIDECQRFVSGL